ncbi:hypothetical protein [Streptomyces sp. NPDC046821]|uniref:hypothetical protein n=1 Tax=Streptomyces sp. NPDC046821 TaxID=3154702 RepID=UPI0033DFCFDB
MSPADAAKPERPARGERPVKGERPGKNEKPWKPGKQEKPENEKPDKDSAPADEATGEGGRGEEPEPEQRQPAWAARRDLIDHVPELMGSLVLRDQFGVAGGHVAGDVNFNFGAQGPSSTVSASGLFSTNHLDDLAAVFQSGPSFGEALARLRDEHVIVLSGSRGTGRQSAALMLLRKLGAHPIRSFDPNTAPAALPDALDSSPGFLVHNLLTSRSRPLLEPHVLGIRERLRRHGGRFVITVETSAVLGDVSCVPWEPPPVEEMLAAHVSHLVGEEAWEALRRLPPVDEFLGRTQQPGEIKMFAEQLAAHHRGDLDADTLAAFSQSALAHRINGWLTERETERGDELRDKAFLISLGVFDKAPYAVAAELGDSLFAELQLTANPGEAPRIPIFGRSVASRLELAHAVGRMRDEVTEWGPVPQYMTEFQDARTAQRLLHEVWNVHPSARPALVLWIQQLAKDGRPLVRARAAAAAAFLAEADLPSAMAHLIEPWAGDRSSNGWLTAANALSLARLLKVPGVSRILHTWCTGEHAGRRWTAIRVYGLFGPTDSEEALDALLDTVRLDSEDEDEVEQLAEATQLLLLTARSPVLARLAPLVKEDPPLHDHALRAFRLACRETEEGTDHPLVLKWYADAQATPDSLDDSLLLELWHAVLGDRAHTDKALETLQRWVHVAEDDPHTEQSLTLLLTALAARVTDRHRISHLLRTAHDADGSHLSVAQRLETAVSLHVHERS